MSFYLILHKVRGEPAFDIAERTTIAGEPGWIISTSGHRAYPICDWRLFDIAEGIDKVWAHAEAVPGWDITPDHYTVNTPKAKANMKTLLSELANLPDEELQIAMNAILGSRK